MYFKLCVPVELPPIPPYQPPIDIGLPAIFKTILHIDFIWRGADLILIAREPIIKIINNKLYKKTRINRS